MENEGTAHILIHGMSTVPHVHQDLSEEVSRKFIELHCTHF